MLYVRTITRRNILLGAGISLRQLTQVSLWLLYLLSYLHFAPVSGHPVENSFSAACSGF